MPKHFIAFNNGYWNECWYESHPEGRKLIKKPLHDENDEPIKGKKNRDRASDIFRNGKKSSNNHKTTFEQFIPEFVKLKNDMALKERSINIYLRDVKTLIPKLPLYIEEVKSEDIQNALASLEGQSPISKGRFARSLGAFLSIAKAKGLITINPLTNCQIARYKTIVIPFTEEQIFALIDSAKELDRIFPESEGKHEALITLALQVGLREDEYFNLRWKWLDIKNRTYNICIDDKFRPKHDHCRIISIPQLSFDLINKIPHNGDYIFYNSVGNRDYHLQSKVLKNIFKGAGIEPKEHQDIDFHQLRKTCASYRLACGEPPQNLSRHLGHASFEELNSYIGVVANISDEARNLFDVNTK